MGEVPDDDPFAALLTDHADFVDKLTELEATLDEMMATREALARALSAARLRITSAKFSSVSLKVPPVCVCNDRAVAKNRYSARPVRTASSVTASSSGVPTAI